MGSEISTFNVKDGYAESLVRGNRLSLLTPDDYRKLAMAETIEDLRSCLEDTDYGDFLQDEPVPLSVGTVYRKCRERFADEFRALQSHAYQPLDKFLEYIIAEKIIDALVSIIQGVLNDKAPEEIIEKADPLVWTPELRALLALDTTSGFDELYRMVLVDTPVGRYFEDYLEQRKLSAFSKGAAVGGGGGGGGGAGGQKDDVQDLFNDLDLEIMRACLKKSWLEDFHAFCMSLGGTTATVMDEILNKQADLLTISVTMNSLNSSNAEISADRLNLFPSFGHLYPIGVESLRRANTDAAVRSALEPYPEYLELYEQCKGYYYIQDEPTGALQANAAEEDRHAREAAAAARKNNNQMSLEDLIYRLEIKMYENAFEQQMHYGVFYAWAKLKEQETRNLLWIADMILMQRMDHMDMVLPIFAPRI